jgi:type II secretory pathway pseudopilin PulG
MIRAASRRRGVTLVELLVAMGLMIFLMIAVARTYAMGINYDSRFLADRDKIAKIQLFEDRMNSMIQHAELATSATQTDSFFIGSVGNVEGVTTNGSVQNSIPSATGGGGSGGGNSYGTADTLIFSASGLRISSSQLVSDDDFETQNTKYGPQGGITEYSIATSPVGQPPNGQTGAFIRMQRPADNDPSQGGNESLLEPDVTMLGFEFWDGAQYDPTWDTRTMTPGRLPAAVRVTYHLQGESSDRVFVVMLPNSDVTVLNPVTQTGTTTAP